MRAPALVLVLFALVSCASKKEDKPGSRCTRTLDGGGGEAGPTCPPGAVMTCPPDKPVSICVYDPGATEGTPRCIAERGERFGLPPYPRPTCE